MVHILWHLKKIYCLTLRQIYLADPSLLPQITERKAAFVRQRWSDRGSKTCREGPCDEREKENTQSITVWAGPGINVFGNMVPGDWKCLSQKTKQKKTHEWLLSLNDWWPEGSPFVKRERENVCRSTLWNPNNNTPVRHQRCFHWENKGSLKDCQSGTIIGEWKVLTHWLLSDT